MWGNPDGQGRPMFTIWWQGLPPPLQVGLMILAFLFFLHLCLKDVREVMHELRDWLTEFRSWLVLLNRWFVLLKRRLVQWVVVHHPFAVLKRWLVVRRPVQREQGMITQRQRQQP